jgi:hypothetical protein
LPLGLTVDWQYYPHTTRMGAVNRSLEHSKPFVATLMAGRQVQNRCAELVPPGPLQTPEDDKHFTWAKRADQPACEILGGMTG